MPEEYSIIYYTVSKKLYFIVDFLPQNEAVDPGKLILLKHSTSSLK